MVFLIANLLVLVAGYLLLNLRIRDQKPAAWIRVSAVYALTAIVTTPMVSYLATDPAFKSFFVDVLDQFVGAMNDPGINGKDMADSVLDMSIRTNALGLTQLVLFCWYVITRFQRSKPVQWRAATALANFRIAEYVVWPLLASLAAFGAGRVVSLPPAIDIAVSVFTIGMVFLYFLQGLGIVAAWFGRSENPGMRRLGLPLVLAILFLVPVFNFVLFIGIPLLGVLELWVRMRPATHDEKGASASNG